MSENKHTPEPWKVAYHGEEGCLNIDAKGQKGWPGDVTLAMDVGEANARRIVACVNACKGIPTYQLTGEDGNPVILGDMIDLLRNQRDTLLPICEELRESAEYWSEYDVPLGIVERLTAAIASVKELK